MTERAALLIATTDADRRPDVPTFRSPQSVQGRRVEETSLPATAPFDRSIVWNCSNNWRRFYSNRPALSQRREIAAKKNGIRQCRIPQKYLAM
jgi:hypothetical protein